MPKKDPRIDAAIRDAAPFAQPILLRLRKVVHKACPDAEETLKWGFPHFMYKGKILCAMVNFKAHCRLGFWTGARLIKNGGKRAATFFDQIERLEEVGDLPSDGEVAFHIREAMRLLDAGPAPRPAKATKPPVRPPADFLRALKANKKVLLSFEGFSPSRQREYVEWIREAKTDETRKRRIDTAVEWIGEGKSRNWKYERR